MSATIGEPRIDRTPASAQELDSTAELAPPRRSDSRVLIVTDCSTFIPPFNAGGTERQLSDLARQLELCGMEVTVVVRESPERPTGAPAFPDGVRTQYVPPAPVPKGSGWAGLGPNLRYIAGTFGTLLRARRRYDVLMVSGFRQLALPMAVLARLARKPCVIRIDASWDLDDELTPESNARIGPAARCLASGLIRASRRLAFRLTDYLVAFSDPLERRLAELGAAPRKIKQIPNGVDTRRFAPVTPGEKVALRRALGLPLDRAIFIYTGRICRAKGLLELIEVWERFAGRRDVHLLLVGRGAHTHESCEAEVMDGIARHPGAIAWRGAVENVAQYLQAADVFIFLSYFEAFSLSILEAVAAGLPCIVTDVGCARQVVRHHESGAIVPTRTEVEVVRSEIDWMLANRSRWPAMGAQGRASVASAYALEAVARRYVALFDAARAGA